MNAMPDSYIVNSCQYTPIYVLQDPGDSQVFFCVHYFGIYVTATRFD